LCFSGVLTGKFQRDSSPEKSGSRVGYIHADEKKALQSAPAWSKLNEDEGYWVLMDTMKEIAEKHGERLEIETPSVLLIFLTISIFAYIVCLCPSTCLSLGHPNVTNYGLFVNALVEQIVCI